MRSFRVLLPALLLLIALLVSPAKVFAGAPHMDCSIPFVYTDSDVNAVVLPYMYAGSNQQLNETGRRLSLLIQADTLLHIIPYGRVASVQLEPSPGSEAECEPSVVLEKLLGKRSSYRQIGPGKGIVLTWGLLYEESGQIYLKSFATALRRDADDAAQLKFGKWSFLTSPSSRVLAFPPRKIARSMLMEIEATYAKADQIYASPQADSPARPLPRANCSTCRPGTTQGYYVDKQQGEWMHVRWFGVENDSDAGWIRGQSDLGGHSLDAFMPELHFVRAAVGYLRMRMTSDETEVKRLRQIATSDLKLYLEADAKAPSETASAVALQLRGIMQVLGGGTPDDWKQAISDFDAAQKLLPDNAEARNTLAVGHIYEDWLSGRQLELSKVRAQELVDTTLLKPDDATAIKNLNVYYQMLLAKAQASPQVLSPKALAVPDIQNRLTKLGAYNQAPKQPAPTSPNY
jgi:hypothetical protein